MAHARDGAAGTQPAGGAVDVVQARQAPAGHDSGAGAGRHVRLGDQRGRGRRQPRPRIGDARLDLEWREPRQPARAAAPSAIGSPRPTRASHLWAVWRLTPPTRSQSSALPLGVSLTLGCCDMGDPFSLCA